MSFFQKLLGYTRAEKDHSRDIPLSFFNTLSKSKEIFVPKGKYVRMYNCGPTVYGTQHIGNLSMFVFTDVLRRTLEYNGMSVKQVINITDVGHLVSDGDDGDDKMTKGLKREGMEVNLPNMKVLAERYTQEFLRDLSLLGVDTAQISFPRATDHIEGQIALIKTLEEKGYTYTTSDGVYFDTSLFPTYGKLGNIHIESLKEGARVEQNSEKKHPADFALWKFSKDMGWDTMWGKGFPGWHIECSAMSRSELGEQLDIHTGGIEHIPVHHNNEIAQSEAATGKKPFSRFWLHREHLQLDGHKIAKSEGNVVYLSDIINKGFHPLSLRYLLLTSHYRTPSSFTWEALSAAQVTLLKLHKIFIELKDVASQPGPFEYKFHERINDDLDTPGALAVLWESLKSDATPAEKLSVLTTADTVLGLHIKDPDEHVLSLLSKETPLLSENIPEEVAKILLERSAAREAKNWAQSDALRTRILEKGFIVKDTPNGQELYRAQ